MAENPHTPLDLLRDIDFSNPNNDNNQLDSLIENMRRSVVSDRKFLQTRSSKLFLEHAAFDKNIEQRIELRTQDHETPVLEVEKSHAAFLDANLSATFDLGSKFTIADTILGPFFTFDELPVYYNFYTYLESVKVFFPNQQQAAMIVPIRLRRLTIGSTTFTTFTLGKGNVWIRADLLNPAAPINRYIGLKINGGQLTFNHAFAINDSTMYVPKSIRFDLELNLDNTYTAEDNPSDVGIDAKNATFDPPEYCKLSYLNSKIKVSSIESISGRCFGWESALGDADTIFDWDSEANAILLRLIPNRELFSIRNCESAFYHLRGSAKIKNAYWMLPTRVLNQNQSVAVKFNGALRLDLQRGLTTNWDGIRTNDSAVSVNSCRLIFYNGEISLLSKAADYNLLHEHYTLWQKSAEKPYLMDLVLNFSHYRAFTLQAQSSGVEMISANVDSDFLIDKPLRADNRPIHPKTENSIYVKGISADRKIVMLLDADLLFETESPDGGMDTTLYQFCIENAYFTTSKEASIYMTGNWQADNHLHAGTLTFNYLLYDILPTLPHPYTTNILPNIGRDIRGNVASYARIGTLQSVSIWKTSDNFTECEVSFKLNQQKFTAENQQQNTVIADRKIRRNPAFTLLDVSTESDHWGISLNFDHLDELRKVYHDDVNITGENVVTISRNNLQAPMALLEGITLPHVSWEPVYNQTLPTSPADPQEGLLVQENNSTPTVFSQFSNQQIPILPKNYIKRFKANLRSPRGKVTGQQFGSSIIFTLPNGKLATVSLNRYNNETMLHAKHLEFIMPDFEYQNLELQGSLQFRIAAKKNSPGKPPLMRGKTMQTYNLVDLPTSILGESVTIIFNNVFNKDNLIKDKGVPLLHIDFSGYGANTFSNWKDDTAKFASIAQAKFDILKGRTAHEIVQAVSVIYPWGIGVTRTVTFLRNNNAVIFREDSGWVAQSEGLFDFGFVDNGTFFDNPYEIYPGLVEGLFNIRNIREDHTDIITSQYITNGSDYYFNSDLTAVQTGVSGYEIDVMLVAVYFDADVKLNALDDRVTGKQFKGYLQLTPEGSPIPARELKKMFDQNDNAIGGSVDTTFNIERTLQKFKANRVEVSSSYQNDDKFSPIMVAAVKGATILPPEGSWSVVEVDKNTGEVSNLKVGTSVGLIKDGMRPTDLVGVFSNSSPSTLLAFADSLKNSQSSFGLAYGMLQNTDTQKLLLSAPEYVQGLADRFESDPALLADCFRLLNTKSPFPNLSEAITLDNAAKTVMDLLPDGIKKAFNIEVPDNFDFDIYGEAGDSFRIYVKYDSTESDGGNKKKSIIDYVTDSASIDQWTNKMDNLTVAVDLFDFKPIMYVSGDFGNGKKTNPSVELGHGPQLKLHPTLQTIYEILEFLDSLDPSSPSEAVKRGLKIAMSNSADSWEYKFKADKEIPLVKFPFDPVNYNSPTTPLKLDAFFRLGVYFNQPIKIPQTIDQIKPSIGAYLELGADIRVMCVSLAAATIYAMGRAEVGLAADLNNPPTLRFKFGFGVELCVGLPVIGSVAVTYLVGIDMKINSSELTVGAFIYFRGRVEIAAGLVTITISIEAAGKVQAITNGPTNCIAMCTFALDISVAFVINLSFSETWEETRQIS